MMNDNIGNDTSVARCDTKLQIHRFCRLLDNAMGNPDWKTLVSTHRFDWNNVNKQGWPQADATNAAALGPAPLRAPRYGVWIGYSFLPDARCASEFSKNGLQISLLANN